MRSSLVTGCEQNASALRIEGESDSPDLLFPVETKLFHVGVLRALEGVSRRPAKVRAVILDELRVSKQFVLQRLIERFELFVEIIMK